jgi:hypothetical protein
MSSPTAKGEGKLFSIVDLLFSILDFLFVGNNNRSQK